ncbi:MAG: class I SAM-dependent methyltransferase [Candidatus Thermoplasmatota archaeon]|nr:class I SAM-dependent methyltransferase [Candidatus Thermoplasmatota archaeon]
MSSGNLYVSGEEKFGFITSHFYGISRLIPTMNRFYNFVISDILKREFSSILDIGSGTGHILISAALKRNDFFGIGIDPSTFMVDIANRGASRHRIDQRIRFGLGSSRYIPGEMKFDLIYSSLSFHHWSDREGSLELIMRRLNPTGLLVIYEITDNGGLNRKFVKSHLMNADAFRDISGKTKVSVREITEKDDFISAAFQYTGNNHMPPPDTT